MLKVESAKEAAGIIGAIISALIKYWDQDYDQVMAELDKRSEIDGSASDAVAKEIADNYPGSGG